MWYLTLLTSSARTQYLVVERTKPCKTHQHTGLLGTHTDEHHIIQQGNLRIHRSTCTNINGICKDKTIAAHRLVDIAYCDFSTVEQHFLLLRVLSFFCPRQSL